MWIALVCGLVFGVAFGLTGVGGSVFAVPMLVYAIGLPPHRAVCVAMLVVSALSLLNTVWHWRRGAIEFEVSVILAAAGIVGAPIGAWIGRFLSGESLMLLFAAVVFVIATRMFLLRSNLNLRAVRGFTSKAARRYALALAGLITGILAGLLGVGGVLIVPALVLVAGIQIRYAIATSQAAVFWIGLSAMSSHLLAGQRVPLLTTSLFLASGALGMVASTRFAKRLSTRTLEIMFSAAMVAVATVILVRTFI
jgi:uncharacterized membrane protein YfcA